MPAITMGIVFVAFLVAWTQSPPPGTKIRSILRRTSSAASSDSYAALSIRISVLECDVFSFYVAKLAQTQLNCLDSR